MEQYPAALQPSPEDIKLMLACEVHRGANNLDPNMERYIWQRRNDGKKKKYTNLRKKKEKKRRREEQRKNSLKTNKIQFQIEF
jgi:ribosomal protein S2